MTGRRAAAVVAGVAVALGLVGVAEARLSPGDPPAVAPASAALGTASRPGALSSTWLCPGGPAAPGATGAGSVVLASPTGSPRAARVAVFPVVGGAGEPGTQVVAVPPRSTVVVRHDAVVPGIGPAGAEVLADGGGLVVTQTVRSGDVDLPGACATGPSDRWYAPVGSTAAGATTVLDLFNPFAGDAIVDLSFATTEGRKVPAELQGLVVPARSVLALDLGEAVRRQDAVAATVATRDGRIAVGRSFRKGSAGSAGAVVPVAAPAWYVPAVARVDGATTKLTVLNPGELDADVSVEVRAEGEPLEPLTLSVPAGDRAELSLDVPALAKGVAASLLVRAGDDVPLVVERSVEGRTTRSDAGALRLGGRRLVAMPVGRGTDALALVNLGERDAQVRVIALDGKGAPVVATLTIATGARTTVKLDDRSRAAAVLVEADQDVTGERLGGEPTPQQGSLPAIVVPPG